MEINLSKLDHSRFGIVTAKANLIEGDSVKELIAQAKALNTELLIVRMPTHCIIHAQNLEYAGGILTDTLIFYQKKKIEEYKIELTNGYSTHLAVPADAEKVELASLDIFKDYLGHYHADPRLDKNNCDAVYSSWAKNSCSKRDLADEVILIKKDFEIAAFATLKIIDNTSYEGVLFGVGKNHQGKGLHLSLMKLSQNWGLKNNKSHFVTSTQITNIAVQKNWCRVSMLPSSSFYTYHLWLK